MFTHHILDRYEYLPVPLCPNCNSKNPSARVRKLPKYRCTDCKHEFEEVANYSVYELIDIFYKNNDAYEVNDKCFVSKKWRNQHNLSSVKYWFIRENATEINAKKNRKRSIFTVFK